MTRPLRLIVFDVDGTLVDSQADIIAAMTYAFGAVGIPVPPRDDILSIVGLSLDEAMGRLAPRQDSTGRAEMVAAYKNAYANIRAQSSVTETSPFYPHARSTLDQLAATPENILGVATGKSRRGLDALLGGHGLSDLFTTEQVADHHPSKPHPSMLHAAMRETGTGPANSVMIGDTAFDMQMARAAGMRAIGVCWGYHPAEALVDANHLVHDFRELLVVLDNLWGSDR